MQYFINHAAIERAAAEVFSSARSRYYLYGLVALAVMSVAGGALAAIWLGLALLVDATRNTLSKHFKHLSPAQAAAAALALDVATTASLAVAPAIAWYSGAGMGGAICTALLIALATDTAFNAKRGRIHALIACTPYALLGLTILAQSASISAIAATMMAGAASAYIFGRALHQTNGAAHARAQDAEWVRQLNMSFGDGASAGWEIDFERGKVAGAQRLGALIGRSITFADIVDRAFFAPSQDRALVNAAFTPAPGAVRRIALEHDVVRADGTPIRVRHQGFVRTTPDGIPVRVTCVTSLAEAMSAAFAPSVMADAQHALNHQTEALRTLNNELSAAAAVDISETTASLAQMLSVLVDRSAALERGVDDLAHARHEADAANLAKSQFLANMSHELRTPLNAIIGYTEMLQEDAEDNGDERAVQDLNRILTAAKHLLSLIGEILDLSKIEAGRMEAIPAKFDLLDVLEELIETVRPIATSNGNEITISGTPFAGDINTDSLKLGQCVLNLLSNAAKFTKNGKIDVAFDRKLHNGVEQLFITVRDTGIGMSKEHVSRLFQPFVQADPSITQQYGGTGLGLTITRRLSQLLGGDVTVKSALGEGSAFTLHVPVDFADAAAALGAAAKVDEVQGNEDAPLVIVIEDEADARELAARALTRAGFAVQGVGGGEAGLALARAKAPALVLLDIFLPDRSGWRVLQSLKHDPKTQDIPVVVLSVNEDRAHALALGAAEHIVKPADRDMLAATVMRYARKRPAIAATASPVAQKAAG
ncbi:MAG: ATP-binding protein [Alphaproteobacteria bacterium]|nr:ATP-binding protein [Alphaproteobacteria bacterium]